ncbi:mitochondrial carrier domain-containing protein [Rhodotorula diobovata]|uniref:Mitochondrial carrier domain-containing protein n=1 Tax=Rhodotorula diobovata TaxID=5288 RepID=A0A5C5FSC7_9BASI|nr:mitochondrial carrier domain-containing protein [Rhodotorula diobovata]
MKLPRGVPHPDALAPAPLYPPGEGVPLARGPPPSHPPRTTDADSVAHAQADDRVDVGLLWRKIGLAGASNMTAAMVTNPADLIKVRQQLERRLPNADPTSSRPRTTNALRTLTHMVRTEGLTSIYKGLSGSLLREISYSGIRMGGYDLVKSTLVKFAPGADPNGFGTKLLGGMGSGMVGAAVANPADLLKVRLQSPAAKGTLRNHAAQIYRSEGIKGFYRALVPTTIRAGILTAAQLGTYDHFKHLLKRDFPQHFHEGIRTHLVASGIAGFCCSAASNPIDVIKVRIMSDKTGQYRGSVHCAALLLKNEGPLAFYKGFSMCFWRLWPHSLVSLVVFEQLRKAVGMTAI